MKEVTKAVMQEDIDRIRSSAEVEVARLKEEARAAEEREMLQECAQKVWGLYQSYLMAGFNEAQAWELVKDAVSCCPAGRRCGGA